MLKSRPRKTQVSKFHPDPIWNDGVFIIIIIIIIIGGLVSTYKNKNSRHYNVIKRSHKNSLTHFALVSTPIRYDTIRLNKNVFKSFLKCGCVCAWRTASGSRFQRAGPARENACSPNFVRIGSESHSSWSQLIALRSPSRVDVVATTRWQKAEYKST